MKKTIIITGASGNLGSIVAKRFLTANYRVWGTVHHASKEKQTDNDYTEVVLDLSDENTTNEFVQQVVKKDGVVNVAVMAAGGYQQGALHETFKPDLLQQIDLNFITAYNIVRPIFEQMKKQKSGRLFLIGSKPGMEMQHAKSSIAYGLSKSLIFRLAELLNAEAGKDNIVTSVIVPGTIDTPENRKAMPGTDTSTWVTAAEIADIIYFYSSEAANSLRQPIIKAFNS
jgi:Dehydrogenases with different specificities (related to short-chain alcohol dehydrogenases)